jgi:hypothetical protein
MLQFFLFTRKEAPAELMRDVLKRAIGPLKYSPPPLPRPDEAEDLDLKEAE